MAKTTVNRIELLNAVVQASAAVPARTPKDVLKNLMIVRRNDTMEVIGTDMEIGIRASVNAAGNDRGTMEVLLSAQRLRTILTEMNDDTVTMTTTMAKVTISGSNAKFNLSTESADEFPPVPEFSKSAAFALSGNALRTALTRTSFAVDHESTRYALGGVMFEAENDTLKIIATDSRRLAIVSIAGCERSQQEMPKTVIVPSKTVRAVMAAADKCESAMFYADAQSITFRLGNVTIYSRLLEGRFPKYQQVIPAHRTVMVPLPVGPFLAAVRQATVVSDKESIGVVFRFVPGNVLLESSSSVGDSLIELPCEYNNADTLEVKFDPRYVADMFKLLPPDRIVELSLVDGDTAALFEYESYRYIVMPLANE